MNKRNNGYMAQHYDNESDYDGNMSEHSHSDTGTESKFHVSVDSPYKDNANNNASFPNIAPVQHHKNGIELGNRQMENNDNDSDQDSVDSHIIEMTTPKPTKTSHKNGYNLMAKSQQMSDLNLRYKSNALHRHLLPHQTCMSFKFIQQSNDKQCTLYVDAQYHTLHIVCIVVMILQIATLHYIHLSFDSVNTDVYVMIAFVAALLIIALFECMPWVHLFDSSQLFSLSVGIALLYLIILYTIYGILTTDRFLIYFILTLTFNTCIGYVTLTQYIILACIVTIEFTLCAVLRWKEIITIGIDEYTSIDGDSEQSKGVITETELYFSFGIVLFTFLYKGYAVYRMQTQLIFEYIQAKYANKASLNEIINSEHLQRNVIEYDEKGRRIDPKDGSVYMDRYVPHISEEEQEQEYNGRTDTSKHQSNRNGFSVNKEENSISPLQMDNESSSSDIQDSDVQSPMNDTHNHTDINDTRNGKNNANERFDSPINYSQSTTEPQAKSPLFNFIGGHRKNMAELNGDNISHLLPEQIEFIGQPQDDHDQDSDNEANEYKDEDSDEDDTFGIIPLIATCKYAAEKAGKAITAVYDIVDTFDNIKYSELRSFSTIEKQRVKNKQRLTAAKVASYRGLSTNKKHREATNDSEHPSSPFKEKLPPFIKNTKLFDLNPKNAAASVSNSIITQSLHTHFPQIKRKNIKFPTGLHTMEIDTISLIDINGNNIEINECKRHKLKTEMGQNIKREMEKSHSAKLEYFNKIEEEDLVIWIEPLEGTQAIKKKDRKDTQRSVTILIGIAEAKTRRPIAGIIHAPFTKETVVGIPGVGLWPYSFTMTDINMGKGKHKSKRVVINKYQHTDVVKHYLSSNMACKKRDVLGMEGGMGNNVLLLMQNEYDAFLHPDHQSTYKWHTCACEAIICALGGDFTQLDGKLYDYSANVTKIKKGFVATLYGKDYHKKFQYKEQF